MDIARTLRAIGSLRVPVPTPCRVGTGSIPCARFCEMCTPSNKNHVSFKPAKVETQPHHRTEGECHPSCPWELQRQAASSTWRGKNWVAGDCIDLGRTRFLELSQDRCDGWDGCWRRCTVNARESHVSIKIDSVRRRRRFDNVAGKRLRGGGWSGNNKKTL